MKDLSILLECNYGLCSSTLKEIEKINIIKNSQNIYKLNSTLLRLDNISLEKAFYMAYFLKTINRISIILSKSNTIDFSSDDIKAMLKEFNISSKRFAVRLGYRDNKNYDIYAIYKKLGRILENSSNLRVDLVNPDIIFRFYSIKGLNYITIDLSGERPLYKRCYKVKKDIQLIRPTIFSQIYYIYDQAKSVVDILSPYGVMSIEGAIIERKVPAQFCNKTGLGMIKVFDYNWDVFFDKIDKQILGKAPKDIYYIFLRNSQENIFRLMASRVLVADSITVRRVDPEWLDLKFEEGSIEFIFLNLLDSSILSRDGRFLDNVVFSIRRIIKNKGVFIILLRDFPLIKLKNSISKNNFVIRDIIHLFSPNSGYKVIIINPVD